MAGLTPAHLLIILVIALIVIGPGKLPEVGAAIGKSFREFQKAAGQIQENVNVMPSAGPAAQPQAPAAQPVVAQPQAPAQSFYAAQPGYAPQPYQPGQPLPGYAQPMPGQQPLAPQAPGYPPQAYGVYTYPISADGQAVQPPMYPPTGYAAPQGMPVAYPAMPLPVLNPPDGTRAD